MLSKGKAQFKTVNGGGDTMSSVSSSSPRRAAQSPSMQPGRTNPKPVQPGVAVSNPATKSKPGGD